MFKKMIVGMSFILFIGYIYSTATMIISTNNVRELERQVEFLTMRSDYLKSNMETLSKNINYVETQLCMYEMLANADLGNNRWDIQLTDDERELLASIVMLEAGGEPKDGQQAVVEVVFNRMKHEEFPSTLYSVLSADGQFATWKNRNIPEAKPTEEVYKNIDLVLAGETNILPFDTVYFGLQPHNNDIETVIDNHVFCNK